MAKWDKIDLEELKKLTGKNSDYGAVKATIEAGYEHLKYHSIGVTCFDKLIWEIERMPLSQVERRLKELREKRGL